ncbi:MAG: rhamnulokinase [Clostridia bacterium]|nr:rhamnulokinase [Clostridia bacterium]
MRQYLAIDIGASSGRHIVGWQEDGEIRTVEVFRFPNGMEEADGHLVWNLDALTDSIREGIGLAKQFFPGIVSLSVDTWGVDYVLMKGDREILPCYAYRDSRTGPAIPEVHRRIPFEELYRRTGIQHQPFNTIYQLYADRMAGRLEEADGFLPMPSYLMYRLCGAKAHEFTEATTGGMVSAVTGEYDPEIADALGFPRALFPKLQKPGTVIGEYRGMKVVLCATHDTASAVEAIPMDGNELFLSSGTWSLLGMKIPVPLTDRKSLEADYSNEGGVGCSLYLKNIIGMWLVNRLRKELCPGKDWDTITAEAEQDSFDGLVDAEDPDFMAPESMKAAFDAKLAEKPARPAGYFRCAYRSLADTYGRAIRTMEESTGIRCGKLYIVGGGAKNGYLNRLTAEATGKQVIALPMEATAVGNIKVQMQADRQEETK